MPQQVPMSPYRKKKKSQSQAKSKLGGLLNKGARAKQGKKKPTTGAGAKSTPKKEFRSLDKSGARTMSGGQARGYTRGGAQLVGMIPRRPKSKHRKGKGITGDKFKPKRS